MWDFSLEQFSFVCVDVVQFGCVWMLFSLDVCGSMLFSFGARVDVAWFGSVWARSVYVYVCAYI